jgi:hypothetical protein
MKRTARRWLLLLVFVPVVLAGGVLVVLHFRQPYPSWKSPPQVLQPNFDAATQAKITKARQVVFLVPFSHWDTDWHAPFSSYSQLADGDILKAIQLAKQDARFRFAMEQVVFVQHFWETHPEDRADLLAAVQRRQLTFAWGGITQPETSLVAPAVQVHNLELGREWIAQTFGPEYVPNTAWQSDAFGNAADFPIFLSQFQVQYLFIGRYQGRCDPDYESCIALPPIFYWTSPASTEGSPEPVLVAYVEYSAAWGDIYTRTDPAAQLAALQKTITAEFNETHSKYLFLPVGFDFFQPQSNLLPLVDRWNASNPNTLLVVSDPESAFQYLATESLPDLTTDLNPIWQAFYDTRPAAKIADKESEYYLTTADKFGLFLNAPSPEAWSTAALNAHYDNISGVSYDSVWNESQAPRYEQTISSAQSALASILAGIAARVPTPLVVFNPETWPVSGVVELTGTGLPNADSLGASVQQIAPGDLAVDLPAVPPLGYSSPTSGGSTPAHPAALTAQGNRITLSNGLVSVTLDGGHGGAFSSLKLITGSGVTQELLSGFGDDITYWNDQGDVYGAFFGMVRAQESQVSAQMSGLASGPLLARARATMTLGGQQLVKTVTVRADDPRIDVDLQINALPNTTAIAETGTILDTGRRTDDLGFGLFDHAIDPRPIAPGDVTYRRSIFYPILYWSDASSGNVGLTLITHGLQGVSGGGARGLMLVREVTARDEGLTDPGVHTLHYAYLPHPGSASQAAPWRSAYEFNQPPIAVWKSGGQILVQLPFEDSGGPQPVTAPASGPSFPLQASLLSAQNAVVPDLFRQGDQIEAVVIRYDLASPASLQIGGRQITLPDSPFSLVPLPAASFSLAPR